MIMPKKRMKKDKSNYHKAECDECGKNPRVRNVIKFKGRFLCKNCRSKILSYRIQQSASEKIKPTVAYTFEEAINKVYEIKGYLTKNARIRSVISCPQILIGHKVKLVLVNEKDIRKTVIKRKKRRKSLS